MYPRFAADIHMSVVRPNRGLVKSSFSFTRVRFLASCHRFVIPYFTVSRMGTSYFSCKQLQNSLKSLCSTTENDCAWLTIQSVNFRSANSLSIFMKISSKRFLRFVEHDDLVGGKKCFILVCNALREIWWRLYFRMPILHMTAKVRSDFVGPRLNFVFGPA